MKQVIIDALAQLDVDDDSHWTAGGEPAVSVVNDIAVTDSQISRSDIVIAAAAFKRSDTSSVQMVTDEPVVVTMNEPSVGIEPTVQVNAPEINIEPVTHGHVPDVQVNAPEPVVVVVTPEIPPHGGHGGNDNNPAPIDVIPVIVLPVGARDDANLATYIAGLQETIQTDQSQIELLGLAVKANSTDLEAAIIERDSRIPEVPLHERLAIIREADRARNEANPNIQTLVELGYNDGVARQMISQAERSGSPLEQALADQLRTSQGSEMVRRNLKFVP